MLVVTKYPVNTSNTTEILIKFIFPLLFRFNKNIKFRNFIIKEQLTNPFNFSSLIYFPTNIKPITLINVPILIILLIFVAEKPLSCNHSCLKFSHNPIEMLKKANIINI